MKDLRKDDQLNIRMRREQKAKIKRAARIVSEQRGLIVEPGPLLLALAMPKIEEIIAAEQRAA